MFLGDWFKEMLCLALNVYKPSEILKIPGKFFPFEHATKKMCCAGLNLICSLPTH